jgi:hypothetical protein
MENFFQQARDLAKRGPSTFSEALFSNPPIFLKKVEDLQVNHLVFFVGAEFEGDNGASKELLNKMIQAMKLNPQEFKIIEEGNIEEIKDQILAERPSVVVTLGAFASNLLLGGQERLSKIHGNFFPRSFSDNFHTQIVPLFHPSFLLINPGMKKSAWMDMQKIMDFIGKPLT